MAYTLTGNWFEIDGFKFEVGRDMLETVNQITYPNNGVTRSISGAMTNISDIEYYTQPSVKIGFKYISIEDFFRLSSILHLKQVFEIKYYDIDFNKIVTHECYAQPTELQNFFSYGKDIDGVRDLSLTFVATLNDRTTHTVTILKYPETSTILKTYTGIEWGTSILLTEDTPDTVEFWGGLDVGVISRSLRVYPNQRMTVFEDVTLYQVDKTSS